MPFADMDGNYMPSQRAEQLAFSHDTFTPGTAEAFGQDTTWTDSLHIKGIERVAYTRFTPTTSRCGHSHNRSPTASSSKAERPKPHTSH